jgi:hypothetical protein
MITVMKMQHVAGTLCKQRLIIKGFQSFTAMYKFLAAQDNNNWKESTYDFKPGTYAMAGGKWHNIKSLDPSILNHI